MKFDFNNLIFFAIYLISPPSIGDDMSCQRYFCFVNGVVEISSAPESYPNKPVLVGTQSDGRLIIDNHADIVDGVFSTLHIGYGYNGHVDVINGATLHMDNRTGSAPLVIGAFGSDSGVIGTLNISGKNSLVSYRNTPSTSGHNESIYVGMGPETTGLINITNGGTFEVLNKSDIYVGSDTLGGGDGLIVINGTNSKMTSPLSEIYVGFYGDGGISISDSGQLHANKINVGGNGGGNIKITGNNSRLIANVMNISGISKVPAVYIAEQGVLNIYGDINIATDQDTKGQLVINGNIPGIVNSGGVVLGNGKSQLLFEHNAANYIFSSPVISKNIGNGVIQVNSGETQLAGDNSRYSGILNISENGKIRIKYQDNLGSSVISNDGELEIDCQNDWTFHNSINGTGYLNINTGGHDFSFQDTTDTKEFTGTLILSDTTFNLSGNNTTALTSAVVRAGSGSIIKVGQGTQAISGFSFDGGAVNFGSLTLGTQQPASSIQVADNLDISGNGAVRISTPTDVNDIPQAINSSRSLLELDDNNATVKLIDASSGIVKGNGGSLQLQDASGQVLSSSTQQHIIRLGKNVAKGTYDYRLTSGVNNDGLYIGYGLTQLDLLTSGTDALELDANGKTGNAADMSARITGTGDLAFNSQKDETVSLSNQNNDYTGVTDIRGGNVLMNSDSALGQTSEIRLATDTRLDMNGHSQTAGKLNGAAGSVLNINGGNLTLTEGGVSAGILSGNGALNVSGGVLDITGASSALTATTTVGEKATVKVHDNDALGTGTVNTAGTLILGKTDSPVMLASSQVNITENGTLSGYGGVSGNVTNSGTLDLRADAPGNVLTVGGNYTGNNGRLLINTVLGDDSSATDKLVIKGDASGQTRVAVTNAGGTGAQTLNGIELIHVDGNADSAEFVQAGRIAAGAYDYTLGRGQGSNSGNWYLTSGRNTPDPMPGPEPEPAPTPDPGSRPEPVPGGYDNDLRPEAGSYTANMAAANTLFVTRLHERLGPVQYTDVMTGETKNTSMWMRHEGGHNRWRDGTGQLKTQGNRYVVQLGGDIAQWGRGETDRWYLGVMAGYGNDHNNTDSVRTGYRSKGSVNGYSTGLYATWFANDETHNGAYLDTWAQYGWFDNHVKGDGLPGESWKSKGLTASLETGYTWKAGEFSGSHGSLNEWYVQPQAQVVWMGVKADEHRESNGTRVESTGDGNVRTRLGVKTWIKGHNRMDDGKSREFRPFVEVNWLHNTREFGTRMNGVTVHQDGARNIGEVKAGVEGQINNRLNLWGNVGVQAGDRGYSDTSAMLGVKYTF